MPEREEVEINLKTTADTTGAKQTTAALNEVAAASKQAASRQVVSPAMAALQGGATKASLDAIREEENTKRRIDAEFQKNITADRLKQQQQENQESSRLYQSRIQQQGAYQKAFADATREGRVTPGGPQGPGGPSLIDQAKQEQDTKRRIDQEYQKNITSDRLKQQQQESADSGRLYQARLQQQSVYERAFASAQRERRVNPWGPQGQGGPELLGPQQEQVPQILRAQIEAQDKELEKTYGPAARRQAQARERIRIQAQRDAAKESQQAAVQAEKDREQTYQRNLKAAGLGEDTPAPPDEGDRAGGGGRGGGGRGSNALSNLTSPLSLVRGGAALLGIGLGINIVAGIGRIVHQAISDAIDDEKNLEVATRSVTAALGTQAPAAINASKAFAASNLTVGTTQQYLQSVTAVHSLTQEYGLNQKQAQDLVTTAGELAKVQGTDLPTATQAIQSVLRGNTSALNQYGISVVDSAGRVKGLNLTYDQLVSVVGRTTATQLLLAESTKAVQEQVKNAQGDTGTLAKQFDALGKAADAAKLSIANVVAAPATEALKALAFVLNPGAAGGVTAQPPAVQKLPDRNQAASDALKTFTLNTDAYTAAGIRQNIVISANEEAFLKLTGYIKTATGALSALEQESSQYKQIQQGLIGPDYLRSTQALAGQGQQQAAQDILAQRQQSVARNAAGRFREGLVNAISVAREIGPNATAVAEQQLAEFDRRAQARTAQTAAQQVRTLAQRAGAGAQAQLTNLDLQQQQRQLYVAQQIADLRSDYLQRELGIVNIQRQEADLADRQRVAARENLDLVDKQIRARQAARPAVQAAEAISYQQQLVNAQIAAIRSDVRRGALDPSALGDIAGLRRQARDLARQAPRADLNALVAQRPETLIQQQLDAEKDTRQLILDDIERQQRGLEDQLTTLQSQQRINDQITGAIQTQLEMQNLAETAARTAAQQDLIAAQEIENAAGVAERAAEAWAANIHNGLTDLQQAQQLLAQLVQGPSNGPTVDLPYNPDRHPAGPPQPNIPQIPGLVVNNNFTGAITVTSQADIDKIANQSAAMTLNALHSAAAGYTSSASSTQLSGALTP